MKITITVEVNDEERNAITAERLDRWKKGLKLATEREVEVWVAAAIRGALVDLLETFDAGGLK